MAILRIWLTFATVHAPECRNLIIGSNHKTAYDQLVDNSHHLGFIEVQKNQDGLASHLDFRLLIPNSGVIRHFAANFFQPSEWKNRRMLIPDDDSRDTYVVTEGAGAKNPGRIAGYASVSKNADKRSFYVHFLEVNAEYRHKGIGQQLSTKVFSQIRNAGGSVFLHNSVHPTTAGAWMYLSSAQKAGYKFAHVPRGWSPDYHTIPLAGLSKSHLANNFAWMMEDQNIFFFTLGQHPLYRLAPVDTVYGLHSMKFETRRIAHRSSWNSFIPSEWKPLVNIADEYTSFFIFAPHETAEPSGAVLMRDGAHHLIALHQKDFDSYCLRILLDATFLNAGKDGHSPLSVSASEFQAKRSTIMAAAMRRGYLLDLQRGEPSNDYTFISVEPPVTVNRVDQETLDIPRDWITTIGNKQHKYNIVAAFDSVGQMQAAVLVKIRNNGDHRVMFLWVADAEQLLNIVQVTFSDALQDMSRVELKPTMFPEWSRVKEVATALGYSVGLRSLFRDNDEYVCFRAT